MAQSFALVLLAVIALGSGCCYGWILSGWWTPCFNNPPIDLGCFPLSYPFNNSAGFYPQSPESMNIQFHVYSRRHNITVTLGDVQQNLLNNYNVSRNTVLIIHGYLEGQDEIWIKDLIRELLIKNDVNIITVDWYQGANSFFYYQSVANARVVGAVLALFVQELISLGSQPSSFHLVGFSLGAHVAGFAGSRLGGIGRITGLDPAGPSFEDAPPEVRLDSSDALFVDVIHTDSTLGIGMGTLVPMGTVDFYVNGGEDQPSCANSVIGRVSAFFNTLGSGFDSMRTALGCSHMRATQLFMQSVNHVCGWPTYLSLSATGPIHQSYFPFAEILNVLFPPLDKDEDLWRENDGAEILSTAQTNLSGIQDGQCYKELRQSHDEILKSVNLSIWSEKMT
nr:inactive pancreatic lipase-related protein 1-like [Biomphalaria glabrata]